METPWLILSISSKLTIKILERIQHFNRLFNLLWWLYHFLLLLYFFVTVLFHFAGFILLLPFHFFKHRFEWMNIPVLSWSVFMRPFTKSMVLWNKLESKIIGRNWKGKRLSQLYGFLSVHYFFPPFCFVVTALFYCRHFIFCHCFIFCCCLFFCHCSSGLKIKKRNNKSGDTIYDAARYGPSWLL